MGKRKNFKIQEKQHFSGAQKVLKAKPSTIRVGIIIGLFVALSSQLFFFNRLAVQGDELKALEQKKAVLTQQKISLEQETVRLSSLTRIDRESREKLGMREGISNVHYLTPEKVASLR